MNGRTGYYGSGSGTIYGIRDFQLNIKPTRKKKRKGPKARWSRSPSKKPQPTDRQVATVVKQVCTLLEVKIPDKHFTIKVAKRLKTMIPDHASESEIAKLAKTMVRFYSTNLGSEFLEPSRLG